VKILFNNVLRTATYAAVNASANFPAANLADDFLRVRYQSTATTDSITITLAETAAVDSFYFGYMRDVTGITVTFRNSGGAAIGAADFSSYAGEAAVVAHFTQIDGVAEVIIDLTGSSSSFYVGGVAAGVAVEMPNPDAAWEDAFTDNSILVRSPAGQVQQQYIEPYSRFLFSWVGVTIAKFTEVKAAAISVSSRPVWVTFFEESLDEYPPGYYTAIIGNPQRERREYRFTFTFEEAR
jgi:hypothetical protein